MAEEVGRWSDPQIPQLHVEVPLSKILRLKLLPKAVPSVCEWLSIEVSQVGLDREHSIAPDEHVSTFHGRWGDVTSVPERF